MKTWRKGQSTGRTFSKSGRMKETSNQIKKSARSMFSITFTVLFIQFHTLSNFGLYVLNKLLQWLLVNLRIIILFTCVFRSKCCWICPCHCTSWAISITLENACDINPQFYTKNGYADSDYRFFSIWPHFHEIIFISTVSHKILGNISFLCWFLSQQHNVSITSFTQQL